MANLTRIKNNQITDTTIVANAKVVPYSISSTLLANNLTYGSDLTITGNLTVQGNSTAIDSTITTIEDPVILLASTQTGSPTVDIGFIGDRGNSANVAFVWREANSEFITAFTSTGETNTTISISSYANFHTNNANVAGNLTIGGNVIGNITFDGTLTAGNLATPGYVSATGNAIAGNVTTAGLISAAGTATVGNVSTAGFVNAASFSATGNITGDNISSNTVSASGNVTAGNVYTSGIISTVGNVFVGAANAGYVYGNAYFMSGIDQTASANKIFNGTSNVEIATANANITMSVNGTANVIVVDQTGANVTGYLLATGNVNGNNITASASLTGANIYTGGIVSATGTVFAGNVDASTGTVGANVVNAGSISAGGNIIANAGVLAATVSASGDVTGGNVLTGGIVSATGNIIANPSSFFIGNGSQLTGVAASSVNAAALIGNTLSSNVTFSSLQTVGTLANVSITDYVSAGGNVTGGNILTAGLISATGTAQLGNVQTVGIISASGNVTGNYFIGNGSQLTGIDATRIINGTSNVAIPAANGNIQMTVNGTADVVVVTATGANVTGYANVTGNLSAGNAAVVGNVNSGNLLTTGYVSATGNVYANTVVTSNIEGATQLTISTVSGDIVINPAGSNIDVSTAWINNLADPINNQDAATKKYVDDVAQGLNVHDSTTAATPGNLATISGGTVSYNNGNAGVGANLVTTGTYTNIDGVAINTVGTRILVKDEANAAWNGIYTYSNSTVLVRATDFNTVPEVEAGDFVFNLQGNIYGNTGWVETAIVTTIGTDPIVFTQFSGAGQYQSGNGISLTGLVINTIYDGNITVNGSNQLSIANGAVLLNPNVTNATGTSFSASGNIDGGNFNTGGLVTATGNVTGGNINTTGLVAGGNITSGGIVSAGGNILGNNISATTEITSATISASGTIQGGNIGTAGIVTATGNITGGNIATAGALSATGTATVGNVSTAGQVSATGNVYAGNVILESGPGHEISVANGATLQITGSATVAFGGTGSIDGSSGNIVTPGIISAAGTITSNATITGGNLSTAGTVSATGNVIGGNIYTGGEVSATGNITANASSFFIGNGSQLTGVAASSVNAAALIGNTLSSNVTFSSLQTVGTLANLSVTDYVSAGGNVIGANIFTGGAVSATGNITAANFTTSGASGNITGANIIAGVTLTATGNVYGANVLTGGVVSATGNVYGNYFVGNVDFGAGIVSGTGNVYAANFIGNISGNIDAAGANTEIQFNTTGDLLGANANFTYDYNTNLFTVNGGNILAGNSNITGTTQAGNVTIAGNDVTGTNGIVTINAAGADVNFAVSGDTVANVFFVDAGTGTASFGSDAQTTNAVVAFNATNSILMPVGNTGQRPGTGVTGMMRFNTTLNYLEVYNNSQWQEVGQDTFTVIADEQFNGDGSTVQFTLGSTQTTSSVMVSINGVVQIPTTAYAVSGTNPTCVLTFTEAPQSGDVIDVREFTTTVSVTSISSGNSSVTATGATIDIQGNLNPTGNLLYSLGNNTNRWSNLWVGGNTIYLGNLQLKEASANTFAVYTADGVTEANIAVGNIDVTSIQSGTSSISIAAPNGNAVLNVAGTNRIVATTTGAAITGIVSATGNIIGSYLFGNGSQITGLPAGYSNTDVATYLSSGTVSTNILTTGLISATGNITGGNIITGGGSGGNITGANVISSTTLTASGNVIGGNITTAGLISATGNIIGGNISATNHTGTTVSVTGTVTGGNVTTAGSVSATGTVIGGNVTTAGSVSATGAITGNTLVAGGFSLSGNTITSTGPTITIDPNGAGGVNGAVVIAGNLSVQGNVTYIDSNVITTNEKSITLANNQSSGAALDGAGIDVGNNTLAYWRFNNATTSWQSNIAITPAANATLNLGGTSNYWASIYATGATVSGTVNTGAIYATGEVSSAGTVTGANFFTAGNVQVQGRFYASNGPSVATLTGSAFAIDGTVSASGNITGGNIITGGGSGGNITGANVISSTTLTASGNVIGGNLSVSTGTVTLGNIVNANGNGVGNIGSSSLYFNTVFAKATSAQYADLAEKYTADAEYAPGTVVSFGGSAEVTQSGTDADRRVAGVVSTNPSYIMNGGLDGANVVTVALTGRVPCRVTGTVRKGDMMVSNGDGTARAEADPKSGAIIGKALADFDGATGVIEVVIGRF